MKLKRYLFEYELSQAKFAAISGLSTKTVNKAVLQRDLSLETAKIIVKATNGEVTYDDLGPQPDKKLKMKKEENIDKEHNENK